MNLFWLSCLLVSTVLVNGNIRSEKIIETPRYLLTLPQVLSPTSNQICITSLSGYVPTENNEVIISLIDPKTNEEIFGKTYTLESDSQCFNVETEGIQLKYVKVKVHYKPHLDVVQMVRFMPSYGMTIIETSKPIYKPGEVLHFRALGFDGWMKPWSENFVSVSVYNAEQIKVMEWQGEELENGMKHYKLPLAYYNTEGTWRIIGVTKSGERIEKTFRVARDVEGGVTLKIKQGGDYILTNEDVHRMVVCAEDSFGVRMSEGSISLKNNLGHYIIKDLPLDEGCAHFYLKNDTLRWSDKAGKAIHGTVEFYGQGTEYPLGISPFYLPVVRSHVHLRVPSSAMVKNYFKPGLPYFGYLLVERPDYTPLPNAEVEICYQTTNKPWQFDETNEKICKTFVSTTEGSIKFIIPPVERSTKQIMIEATIPGVADHKQVFVVHPWAEQGEDQFIIEPIVRLRSCKRSMPEATKYNVLMTRNGTKSFDRLYLQPVGRVSAARTASVKLSPTPYTPEKDLLIGEWPVDREVYHSHVWEDVAENRFTPMNRVVFYGLDSRGALISDSIAYLKDCLEDETLMDVDFDENRRLNIKLRDERIPCSVSVGTSAKRGRLTEQKINKLLERFDDTYAKTFEWDKCSLESARTQRPPLMIDFKNNWDTFREIGLHAQDSHADIFHKPCEWDIFDEELRNKSREALSEIRSYLPYSETMMNSLANYADMSRLTHLENSQTKDLLFMGTQSELNEWLARLNPSLLDDRSSIVVNAICLDPIRGIRSHTIEKRVSNTESSIYLEHDLPERMSDRVVREVSIFIKRHESSIKESECVPVELEVDSDESFEVRSELPKLCACSKATKVTLKVKPLKKGPLNLKVKAKFAESMAEECSSMIKSFETQQTVLKTNVVDSEPKITRRTYEIACDKSRKSFFLLMKGGYKTHVSSDLVNIYLKQIRDDTPVRQDIYEVLNKFNALMSLYEQNERAIPSTLLPKIKEALSNLYQQLALFRLSNGAYSVYGGSQRVPSLVATTLAYRAISQAQTKLPIFGGDEVITPTFDNIISHMMKDGCFRAKNYTRAVSSMWPFVHEVSQLELTAFVASTMAESKVTPKVILRRAAKCIDQLKKQEEEMDSLTRAMIALLYAKLGRTTEAETLIQDFEMQLQKEKVRVLSKNEKLAIPSRFVKSDDKVSEELDRARAYLVLAKLALGKTENLQEQIQRLVSSDLSLHDPIITLAVTRAWPKISIEQQSDISVALNKEKMAIEKYQMKKIENIPQKKESSLFEILSPGCVIVERVEEIDLSKYNETLPAIEDETLETLEIEGTNAPLYEQPRFKILRSERIGESCENLKIKICQIIPTMSYRIVLPPNYDIDAKALDRLIASRRSNFESFQKYEDGYNFRLRVLDISCSTIPIVRTGEMIDETEKPTGSVIVYDPVNNRDLVATFPITCSDRSRRSVSAPKSGSKQVRNNYEQQQSYEPQAPAYETQSTYEAPVKGYQAPPTYEQAPYEAPVKGYPAPPPQPAYEPAYPAPPAYAPAPAYPAPAYPAPAYPAPAYPAKGYIPPPPPPTYQAPAYEPAYAPPAYQAPTYEAPVKGYAPPPPPPAYEPAYPAPAYAPPPVYEAPAYPAKGYAPPAYTPAKGYPAPAYRNALGRSTPNRYEKNFAKQATAARRLAATSQQGPRGSQAPQYYRPAASELSYVTIKNEECKFNEIAPTCPDCRNRIQIDIIDKLCNSSVVLTGINYGNDDLTCGTLTPTHQFKGLMTEAMRQEKPFAVDSKCDCPAIKSTHAIMISDLLSEESVDEFSTQGKSLGSETIILPSTPFNMQEMSAFIEMCDA